MQALQSTAPSWEHVLHKYEYPALSLMFCFEFYNPCTRLLHVQCGPSVSCYEVASMYHGALTNGSLICSFTKRKNRGAVVPSRNNMGVRCKCRDIQTTSIYIGRFHYGCRRHISKRAVHNWRLFDEWKDYSAFICTKGPLQLAHVYREGLMWRLPLIVGHSFEREVHFEWPLLIYRWFLTEVGLHTRILLKNLHIYAIALARRSNALYDKHISQTPVHTARHILELQFRRHAPCETALFIP